MDYLPFYAIFAYFYKRFNSHGVVFMSGFAH